MTERQTCRYLTRLYCRDSRPPLQPPSPSLIDTRRALILYVLRAEVAQQKPHISIFRRRRSEVRVPAAAAASATSTYYIYYHIDRRCFYFISFFFLLLYGKQRASERARERRRQRKRKKILLIFSHPHLHNRRLPPRQ
ncbi:unnamed protein product [Aphis gossypii]|uniref:Uncharacterized protein n=1 Tax=Aphis gossypii TaxID=80765 RepID=A0A9P0IW07_APHGO|nr:unnamed protein product [Aphis gossypii]